MSEKEKSFQEIVRDFLAIAGKEFFIGSNNGFDSAGNLEIENKDIKGKNSYDHYTDLLARLFEESGVEHTFRRVWTDNTSVILIPISLTEGEQDKVRTGIAEHGERVISEFVETTLRNELNSLMRPAVHNRSDDGRNKEQVVRNLELMAEIIAQMQKNHGVSPTAAASGVEPAKGEEVGQCSV